MDLGLTVTHDLTRHDGDLTLKAGLGGLDLGGQGHDLGVHLLASEGHGAGGGGTHGTDVLHGLGETHVSEGGTLSDLVVQETDRGRHLGVEGLALLGHAGVQLAEAVVGLLLGLGEGTVDLAEGSSVATHGGGIRGGQVGLGGATSGGNASLEGGDVALHLGGDGTGVLGHLVGVAGKLVVGLLELLVGLSLEGEESTVLGSHGVADRTGSTTLLTVDLPVEATTGGGGLAVVAGKHSVEGSEAAVGPLHRLLQVGLGLLGGGFDGEEDLLLKCLTGSLGLHVESVDGFGGGLAQGRDHGADLGGQSSLVLLVDAAHLLLNSDGTLLTLLDGNRDGMADVTLVGGLHGLEHGATLGGLDGVSGNDTGQLVDLVLLLLGDLHGNGVHAGETTGKESLGLTERVSGVTAGTAGGGHLLAVGSTLHGSVLGKGSVELVGSTTEVVGLVATVLLHLMTDLAHLHLERVSHALHATESLGLVLGHEGTKLLVLLDVSVVTLVAKLHHALKLSMNVVVHASLLELVASHGVLQGGHTGVELGDLAARGGGGLHEANLELSTRGVDTGSGLLLGIRDVLHGLSETTVLEGLLGAQGGVHAGGGSLKHHVGVVAILGHASTDLAELGSSGGSDGTDLVVREVAERLVLGSSLGSELGATLLGLLVDVRHLLVEAAHGLLGVLTDLRSVGSDVLVGLLDLRVGGGGKSRKSTLLVEHRDLKAASSSTLVLAHDLASLGGTADGGAVALVLHLSLGSELGLHTTHVAVEGLLGTPGVDGHLGEERLLHRGTGGLVVSEVTRH